MLVSSRVKGGVALFQTDGAASGSLLQHQLVASEPFPVNPTDKPIQVDLSFFQPNIDVFEESSAGCKLIKPQFLVQNAVVVSVSSDL